MNEPTPPAQESAGDLLTRARRWRDADPDPATRAEVDALLAAGTPDARRQLAELFGTRLRFGTAGIRGRLGPGPGRMNQLLCQQVAAGIASVCLEEVADAARRGIVVAHDARHGSSRFASGIESTLISAGLDVHRIDGPAPTPLGAFAVRHLGAAAGIVVTASHNPPYDNGIKVYWSDGAQIAPPLDTRIAEAVTRTIPGETDHPPVGRSGALHELGRVEPPNPLVQAYLRELAAIAATAATDTPVIAHTSLHGVGGDLLELTLEHFGYDRVSAVTAQREPDPDFPTVAFPNPEEPGAMDELLELAASIGADLALANDPDADRLAAAVPRPGGGWRVLTGDELGALLAVHLLEATEHIDNRLVATTVVSSRLLAAIAGSRGVHFEETLTGFKWLCRPALEHPEYHQVLIYEEALGYAIGPGARDKDGIAAALATADMVRGLGEAGRTVLDVLDDLARHHGAHVTRNGSVRLPEDPRAPGPAAIASGLRSDPPRRLGGLAVTSVEYPAEDVARLWMEDGTRVVLRPSGTEPKFKYYCEAIEAVDPREPVDTARARAVARLEGITSELQTLLSG
ncbi:MAG: phospho-sugar mutase [Microthrixaceae bacterium]|nr:phospho-sugar mutase [Microthrixaceae bacterium]